jgi:hypothetical protein
MKGIICDMSRCQNCFLQEGKFDVVLSDKGICNYCDYFKQNKQDILNINNREPILTERLNKLRGKYEYDAAVGLSGGKDSTYVIYQMVNKYNLKVLAATYDNGFLTDYAKQSIKTTVKELGVDHYYHKPNWHTHKKFYKAAVQKLGDPCIACAIGGYFLAIKICYEKRIPFFIHGRTPFQMYRNFYKNSKDFFLTLMKLNLAEHSFTTMSQVYGVVNENMMQLVYRIASGIREAKEIVDEFFVDSSKLTEEFVPEFLAYFLFEEYNEEKIKRHLEDTLKWRRPIGDNLLGHYDCAIHDAAAYIYRELNDVNVLEPDVAVMARFGVIDREEAEGLIELNEPTILNTDKSYDSLCTLCGFTRKDLGITLATLKQAGVSKLESR